jgi:hypothetical protein
MPKIGCSFTISNINKYSRIKTGGRNLELKRVKKEILFLV